MKKAGIIAAAAVFAFTSSYFTANADETVALDEKVIEQIYDENDDGVKDINDIASARHLSLNLTDIDDISFLRYAVSCRYLNLSNSSLTDFSVLKEMKSLNDVSMNKIKTPDLSFLENTGIQRCRINGSDITDEEKQKYIRAEDYTIPEGQLSVIGMYPDGLFEECELVIKDPDIISFGEYGVSESTDGMEGIVVAGKQGETEYSLVADGKIIKTGRIKVIPQLIQDFPLEENIIKTEKIEGIYCNEKNYFAITNSDHSLWLYDGKEYTKAADNVREYDSSYSSYGNPFFILFNDGRMTINDEPVFEDDTKVSSMYCSYTGAYVTTENNELWYVEYVNDRMEKYLISEDCVMFNKRSGIFMSSDSNCYYIELKTSKGSVYSIKNIELGKYDASKIVYGSYRVSYILDNAGTLFQVERQDYGAPSVTVFDEDVTDIGILSALDPESSLAFVYCPAYIKNNSMYKIYNKKSELVEEADKYFLADEDSTYGSSGYNSSDRVHFIPYDSYSSVPARFADKYIDSDFTHMFSRRDENKTEYISFCGYYGAITNSEFSYGSVTDGDDYIILVIRSDGSLWEYYVAQQKFVRKNFGKQDNAEVPEYTASDLLNLISYMYGKDTKSPENADINEDGIINIADVVLLKNKITGEK